MVCKYMYIIPAHLTELCTAKIDFRIVILYMIYSLEDISIGHESTYVTKGHT